MLKSYKNCFENERKIKRRSFLTERERKTFEKLSASASGAQKISFERTRPKNSRLLDFCELTKGQSFARLRAIPS